MILNIHYMISLALLFVMVATGCWRKSYSTFVLLLAATFAMYSSRQCDFSVGQAVVNITFIVLVVRAIINNEHDKVFK